MIFGLKYIGTAGIGFAVVAGFDFTLGRGISPPDPYPHYRGGAASPPKLGGTASRVHASHSLFLLPPIHLDGV